MRETGFDESQVGERIDNIPDSGTLTGNWETDHYGCWWECKLDKPDMGISAFGDIKTHGWLIGEYPDSY